MLNAIGNSASSVDLGSVIYPRSSLNLVQLLALWLYRSAVQITARLVVFMYSSARLVSFLFPFNMAAQLISVRFKTFPLPARSVDLEAFINLLYV